MKNKHPKNWYMEHRCKKGLGHIAYLKRVKIAESKPIGRFFNPFRFYPVGSITPVLSSMDKRLMMLDLYNVGLLKPRVGTKPNTMIGREILLGFYD